MYVYIPTMTSDIHKQHIQQKRKSTCTQLVLIMLKT